MNKGKTFLKFLILYLFSESRTNAQKGILSEDRNFKVSSINHNTFVIHN